MVHRVCGPARHQSDGIHDEEHDALTDHVGSDGAQGGHTSSTTERNQPDGFANREQQDVVYIGFVLGHGGDALQMLALADGVQGRGSRVKIVVPAGEHSVTYKQRCEDAGVTCERSDLLVADMHGSRQHMPSLIRLLRSVDAPIVHFHTGNSILPRSMLAALEVLRYRRTFVTLQSPYETIDATSLRARFWSTLGRRRFHAVVSPSDHGTAFQRRCGMPAALTVTIRNSIDVAAMSGGDAGVARAQLGVDADSPIVLFSSRMDSQKRPVDAVRAFARVAADHPRALLVFMGSGDEEPSVRVAASEAGLSDRVHLVGYQTNVADWLAAATVWILPTERENFSVAVLEALAAGCPILSTPCPGNDEVLVDGQNALIFPVGDVDTASQRLALLLDDEVLRRNLSARARVDSEAFTVQRMVERYEQLYSRFGGTLEHS